MFNRLSLTLSMLLLTASVGVVVWVISDIYQSRELSTLFKEKLNDRLISEARDQRLRFQRHIEAYNAGVRMYASRAELINYINQSEWFIHSDAKPILHERVPTWLPKLSLMRSMILPRYAMLLDEFGRMRELYHYRYPMPPDSLLNISEHELELSRGQSHITMFDDQLFLITAEYVGGKNNNGTLMLASPIDDQLLRQSQGEFANNGITALLKDGESTILVSSDSSEVPKGTEVLELEKQYLLTGEDHFGTGSSDFMIKFASLISTDEVKAQTKDILNKDRNTRAVNAFFYFVAFGLVMFWVTSRIQKLTRKIVAFSYDMDIPQPTMKEGDQINELESRFELLASAVQEETATLEHQALHDELTNMPNRTLFNDRLESELLNDERFNKKFVLIISDLNRFKVINVN